ncbi:MAG: hypothetical protein ASARMPREDX12_000235 [Alectoria sarmentosa]|nr:MAG: hypothetical protein ASARMPRED_001133 [Alectoria sarmentosa]CAD6580683.1 MAG: hypothetical protein ASARMPREDX12_000235 [Alectoria sarmentosa]
MDLFQELENMAINVADECDVDLEPNEDEIARWQKLFAYTYPEAVEQITNQKNDYSKFKVSDDLWDLVKSQMEAQGYSRAAYEHEIKMGGRPTASHDQRVATGISASQARITYLVLLEGELSTPESIQAAVKLPEPPQAVQAFSETGISVFCRIDGNVKQAIESWLSQKKSTFRPTFVRLSKAKKDLATTSMHPTLGIESTLPHHRASFSQTSFSPLQDEYPVWYSFYGTLADSAFLTRLLSLPEAEHPVLVPASISRGVVKTWQDKYNALVDGASTDCVHGVAYRVTTKEREEALLLYETEKYEVVRCSIMMESGTVEGLTFRFAGCL